MSFQAPAQPRPGGRAVALGEMIKRVSLLVPNAPLHRHVVAEHPSHGFPQRFRSVDHEQQALLDVDAPVEGVTLSV